jgi:molybdopterin-binding protein
MTLGVYAGNMDVVRDVNDAASYASLLASTVTPISNCLLVAPIWTVQSGGASPPSVSTVSGYGLTWESVYGPDEYDSTGTTFKLQVYAALTGATPAAGNISYTLGSTSISGAAAVDYFVNVDTSGGTAVSCFVQTSSVAQGTATSGSQTLAALSSSRNVAYSAIMHVANEANVQGSNLTLLTSQANTSPSKAFGTEWAANQTVCDWSWTTSSDYGIWAAEIKALPEQYGVWFVP